MIFNKLFELREYNDLTQKDLAEYLGVKHNTYSEWERGIIIIPLKHLNSLCNYYEISLDYFFGFSNNKQYKKTVKILNKVLVGRNLKNFRIQNNFTQQDIADVLNTSRSTISAYENGETLILTAFLYQLCKKYNLSADSICNRK